jgi:iron complex outermembrane receptor protein
MGGVAHAQTNIQTEDQSETIYNDNTIVVTASKRATTVQDTSLAVTALAGAGLTEKGITDLKALQTVAPTVTIGDDNGVAKIFMRGVGLNTSVHLAESGVALYVDGAVISRPEAQLTSFFDLERVEVVRGPQGTLYGRNAVGGAVNLIAAKPTSRPEGAFRATIGSYDQIDVEGFVSGPITDTLSARLAVRSENRGGYGKSVLSGRDIDNSSRRMGRAQLLWEPSSDFSWLISGEMFRQNDASGAIHYGAPAFPGTAFIPAGLGGFATNIRDTAGDFDPWTKSQTWAVTSTVHAKVNDWLSIVDVANYREFGESHGYDYDISTKQNNPIDTGYINSTHHKGSSSDHFSNDLQFHTDFGFVKGVIGLFYFHERMGSWVRFMIGHGDYAFGPPENRAGVVASGVDPRELSASCSLEDIYDPSAWTGGIPSAPGFCTRAAHETTAFSAYGQYLFDLGMFSDSLAGLSIKAGARYNREKRSVRNSGSTTSTTSSLIFAPGVASRVFKDFTPEIGFEWKFSKALLAYYTYSEGFKSGVGEAFSPGTARIIGPETIQNHEVGLKSTFLDGRANLNVAAFTYNLQGLQIQKTQPFGPGELPVQLFENATGVKAKGVEVELYFAPIRELRFNAGISYLDSKFTDFMTTDNMNPSVVDGPMSLNGPNPFIDLKGNPTRNSPKFSGSGSVEADILKRGLPGDGILTARADVFYRSTTYYSEYKRLIEGQSAFAMLDLSLRYKVGPLLATAWVKNVTDKLAVNGSYAGVPEGEIGVSLYPPRTYGLTIGYNF